MQSSGLDRESCIECSAPPPPSCLSQRAEAQQASAAPSGSQQRVAPTTALTAPDTRLDLGSLVCQPEAHCRRVSLSGRGIHLHSRSCSASIFPPHGLTTPSILLPKKTHQPSPSLCFPSLPCLESFLLSSSHSLHLESLSVTRGISLHPAP